MNQLMIHLNHWIVFIKYLECIEELTKENQYFKNSIVESKESTTKISNEFKNVVEENDKIKKKLDVANKSLLESNSINNILIEKQQEKDNDINNLNNENTDLKRQLKTLKGILNIDLLEESNSLKSKLESKISIFFIFRWCKYVK